MLLNTTNLPSDVCGNMNWTMATSNEVVDANYHRNDDNSDVKIAKTVRPEKHDPGNGGTEAIVDPLYTVQLREFKHKKHSLGINASSVAACVGYHEFQSLPELMLKHVYQGGQNLLEHDARLLGLQLVDENEADAELLGLAESSGSSKVLEAVQRALKIKHGDREERAKLASVDDARLLKEAVEEDGKKLLTPRQLNLLKEGTRQAVDTGCGNSWEEEALDKYQDLCGEEVRERNAECRVWHFETTEDETENSESSTTDTVSTIKPMGPAHARHNKEHSDANHRYDSRGVKRKKRSSPFDSQLSETALMGLFPGDDTDYEENDGDAASAAGSSVGGATNTSIDVIDINSDDEDNDDYCNNRRTNFWLQNEDTLRPFVTIKGMVDGIRDEFGPTTTQQKGEDKDNNNDVGDDDDDLSCSSFSLSRVVVECKHRMRALLPNGPRFSECIQAVVYCFMYEADDADIVQVLRTTNPSPKANAAGTTKSIVTEKPLGPLMTDYFKKASPATEDQTDASDKVKDENDERAVDKTKARDKKVSFSESVTLHGDVSEEKKETKSNVTMKIAVDRVSLDDPQFQHRANWKAVILPKLRRWVDAVYTIRESDDKRYRLLTAVSMIAAANDNEQHEQSSRKDHVEAAWEVIFEECDFLRDGMSGERYRIECR